MDGHWYVRQRAYRDLYERYSHESWADAIRGVLVRSQLAALNVRVMPEYYLQRIINGPSSLLDSLSSG